MDHHRGADGHGLHPAVRADLRGDPARDLHPFAAHGARRAARSAACAASPARCACWATASAISAACWSTSTTSCFLPLWLEHRSRRGPSCAGRDRQEPELPDDGQAPLDSPSRPQQPKSEGVAVMHRLLLSVGLALASPAARATPPRPRAASTCCSTPRAPTARSWARPRRSSTRSSPSSSRRFVRGRAHRHRQLQREGHRRPGHLRRAAERDQPAEAQVPRRGRCVRQA